MTEKHDSRDPAGEYYVPGYELERESQFCACEGAGLNNIKSPVSDIVMNEVQARIDLGKDRYGHEIDINDGREWLNEAIEEAIDQVFYLVAFREWLKYQR